MNETLAHGGMETRPACGALVKQAEETITTPFVKAVEKFERQARACLRFPGLCREPLVADVLLQGAVPEDVEEVQCPGGRDLGEK